MTNIKEQFPEFYQEKLENIDLENESDNLIILDTNFLLDIIRYPTNVAEKYITALEKVKNNLYVPYLVALEFNFNKSTIKKEKHRNIEKYKNEIIKVLDNLKEKISNYKSINILDFKPINIENTKDFSHDLLNKTEEFKNQILNTIDDKITTAITKEEDIIYEKLINIIGNKIGEKYTQDWIDNIESEGKERYKNELAPGFNDDEKEDSRRYDELCYQLKFGDLIIWKDILKYSKNSSKEGTKVIYITDEGQSDKKSDLLYKIDNLIVGPHIFLMNELQRETKKELYILRNYRFIQLVTALSDQEIQDIKYLSTRLNEKEKVIKVDDALQKKEKINSSLLKYIREIRENEEEKDYLIREIKKNEETRSFLIRELEELEKLEKLENVYLDGNNKDKVSKDKKMYNLKINSIKNEIYILKTKAERDLYNLREILTSDTYKNKYNSFESDDYYID